MKVSDILRRCFLLIAFVGLFSLSACKPRGESQTLDEIFNNSKARFSDKSVTDLASGEIARTLQSTSQQLDSLLSQGGSGDLHQVGQLSASLADLLNSLLPHAGVTSRPGLSELIEQYQAISRKSLADEMVPSPTLKLLVARTYLALSSELETTEFRLG